MIGAGEGSGEMEGVLLQPRRRLVRQGLRACMGKGGSGLRLEEGSQL